MVSRRAPQRTSVDCFGNNGLNVEDAPYNNCFFSLECGTPTIIDPEKILYHLDLKFLRLGLEMYDRHEAAAKRDRYPWELEEPDKDESRHPPTYQEYCDAIALLENRDEKPSRTNIKGVLRGEMNCTLDSNLLTRHRQQYLKEN